MSDLNNLAAFFGEPIHRYTRAQALADGVLIDVSEVAGEAGITYPVALTRAVYERYVKVPPGVLYQDEAGRLWDIVFMFRCAVASQRGRLGELRFRLHVRNDNRERTPPLVTLKAVCGPGDDGEPVITIMLPEED